MMYNTLTLTMVVCASIGLATGYAMGYMQCQHDSSQEITELKATIDLLTQKDTSNE